MKDIIDKIAEIAKKKNRVNSHKNLWVITRYYF